MNKIIRFGLLFSVLGMLFSVVSCNPGPKGEQGEPGVEGKPGEDGKDGEDGDDASMWLTGEGKPKEEDGNEGDLYLDLSTSDVYLKKDGKWTKIGNNKGDDGQDGANGSDGADGENGSNGSNGGKGEAGKPAYSSIILPSENGTIVPNKGSVYEGENVVFTFTPNDGFKLENYSINGILKTPNRVLEENESYSIEVSMKKNRLVISANFVSVNYSITIQNTSVYNYMKIGDNFNINVLAPGLSDVIISSSNPDVADFDANSSVHSLIGKTVGVTTITAKSNSKPNIVSNEIVIKVSSISLVNKDQTDQKVTVKVDSTSQLIARHNLVDSDDYGGIVYVSENVNIATIDNTGLITGVSEGTTTIYAKDGNGRLDISNKIVVEVKPKLTFSRFTISYKEGKYYEFDVVTLNYILEPAGIGVPEFRIIDGASYAEIVTVEGPKKGVKLKDIGTKGTQQVKIEGYVESLGEDCVAQTSITINAIKIDEFELFNEDGVKINLDEPINLYVNKTSSFTYKTNPTNAINKEMTIQSSNPGLAQVVNKNLDNHTFDLKGVNVSLDGTLYIQFNSEAKFSSTSQKFELKVYIKVYDLITSFNVTPESIDKIALGTYKDFVVSISPNTACQDFDPRIPDSVGKSYITIQKNENGFRITVEQGVIDNDLKTQVKVQLIGMMKAGVSDVWNLDFYVVNTL